MLKNAIITPNLAATDLQRARKFYEETLGLPVKEEIPGGILYECGNDSAVFVYPSSGAGTNKATAANWRVDNLEAEVAELRSRGVVFEEYDFPGLKTENGIATMGGVKAAWFKDTEGNILGVIQR